ncbi:MAG: type IX secretion system membrane protein PorP/SprF [bacterium]
MLQVYNSQHFTIKGSPLLVALFVFFLAPSSHAQQNPLITQYMFTNFFFNPGAAGSSGGICATGLFREQWLGFKDTDGNKIGPQTFFLTVDSPIKVLHGAVGGSVFQDKIGFLKVIGVKVGYAFIFGLGPGDFSIGVQLGFQNPKIDFTKFKPVDADDQLLQGKGTESDMMFDLAAGLYYRIPDKFYAGLSSDQLLESQGKSTNYQLRRHYYLTSGYQWSIPGHPAFELQPSLLLMFDGAAFQFNLSALVEYNNKFYGGLAYRIQDAVSILAGVNFKGFRIGAAYDICTSSLSKANSGSIEVMLSYCFKIDTDKYRKSYHNTRFL